MLVRPGVPRQSIPMRQLLASGLLRLSSRCCVATARRPISETRRVLTTGVDARPWKKKTFRALVGFERNLATALEEHRFGDDVPFDRLPGGMGSHYRLHNETESPLYMPRPFDTSSPLVIPEPRSYPARKRINPAGIPGDLEEMLSVFEACLQVGRLDRAALVLKRFDSLESLEPHELLRLHNRYLEARVAHLEVDRSPEKAEEIHKWFELLLRAHDMPFTPTTIAYMLKTTLLATEDEGTLRLRVNRYMSMMPEQSGAEALDMGDVLTDEDLETIAELCPQYYLSEGSSGFAEFDAAGELDAEDGAASPTPANASTTSTASPQVLSTPQKGVGLVTLKSTLSLFAELPEGLNIASLSHAQRSEVQAKLERDCVDAAVAKWRSENESLLSMGLNSQLSTPSLSSRLYEWHGALEARLAEEQGKVEASELAKKKTQEDLDRCMYGNHLLQSPPHRLAAVTLLAVLGMLAMHGAEKGVPLANMVQQLARMVEEDIRTQELSKANPRYKLKPARQQSTRQLLRRQRDSPAETTNPVAGSQPGQPPSNTDLIASIDKTSAEARWPAQVKSKFGAMLLGALIDTARLVVRREHPETKLMVTQALPAFSHNVILKKGRKVGVIQPHRTLVELMRREPRGEALARHLPMVVEPVPWSKFDKGGFIQCPSQLIRLKNNEPDQRFYCEAAIERGDMEQMMRGLDVLGKTAWNINRQVFDVMLEAWNSAEEFANFPALDPKLPLPEEPDSTDDPMKRRIWLRSIQAIENERSGMHSVRCFMNFQLEIARAFRDQTFYFPHNLDFRGRAYPLPTYLNHMGADHMRGLLLFAEGKPLGEAGLRWLKVHLANVYGFDKASLRDREMFAMDNMDNIFDSADNPMTGKRWWLKAEDPWQCLATCFELKAAMSSPDPLAFVSHLPVHQDGTCNGLQHYAALGGDTWGAQQVNLLPGDRPADVYSAVAELVQEEITRDVAAGNPFAKAVDGKIKRKVVKQTVMTNVYGVTFVGAKKQVQKQLDALYPDIGAETGHNSGMLATYIAARIFRALSTMFRGAHDIQNWLGEIGGRVCRSMTPEQLARLAEHDDWEKKKKARKVAAEPGKAGKTPRVSPEEELSTQFRSTLVWTTPLRMPVVQPYRKNNTRLISTCLQDLVLTNAERDDPVNRRKQLQAFPPNFIHSLDASHMMLSALECGDLGLTFAAVHDSFWTHAADVDTMNGVIRDAFIRIHQEDVIGRLKAEFEARYRGSIYRAKIDAKSDVARFIAAHRKTHRKSAKDELLEEARRQELLRSMDPEEVKQGREMVTPASIFESMATPDAVVNEVDPEEMRADAEDDEVEGSHGGAEEGKEAAVEDAPVDGHMEKFTRRLAGLKNTNYFVIQTDTSAREPYERDSRKSHIALWMPLTFPDIPKKGSFDVSQLKESKYFFS